MSFFEAIKYNFTHYADFKGRAQRSQFWWWQLFMWIIYAILNVIDGTTGMQLVNLSDTAASQATAFYGGGILATIWGLATLLPSIAVAVRRLHDTGKSGWWFLLNLLCCIGTIILIVWYIMPGTKGENRFGPEPPSEII